MVNTLEMAQGQKGCVEKMSLELMESYEAFSTISSAADQLAVSDSIQESARIILNNALDLSQSSGGALFIPLEDQCIELAAVNSSSPFQSKCLDWMGTKRAVPYYDDGPFEGLTDENGSTIETILYIPFSMGEGQLGLLCLFSIYSREYTSIDIKMTHTLCCQGALALRCLQHLKQIEEKNVRLKETLNQLRSTQDELVRSERLSALGQMASMIVHDIKNPMGGLLGYAQLLNTMADSLNPEEIKEYSSVIIKEMGRLSNMTEEIMTFSRGMESQLNLREITPKNLVSVAAPIIDSEYQSCGCSFEWEGLDSECVMYADSDKMERVFINLANNALGALREGGYFSISATVDRESGFVEFTATDNGEGIPPDFQEKIFEPFQTRKSGKNLGIGLSVARWIVEAHGGQIWLESTGERGSQFKIRLPIEPPGNDESPRVQ